MPSSVIRSFAYDPERRILRVIFTSGRRYAYHDVPPDLPIRWRAAFAKGVFFNRHIRGRFAATEEAEGTVGPGAASSAA